MGRKTNLLTILREIGHPVERPKRPKHPLDFAVVGLGEVGLTHIKLYRKLGHKVVAVAEVSEEVVEKNRGVIENDLGVSPKFIFTGEDAHKELLELSLAGVSVCTPPFARREVVSELLDAGLDLLVEIPLAANLDDARHILDHIDGNITAMPYPWRNVYPLSILKVAIERDYFKLGNVKGAKFRQEHNINYAGDGWRADPEKGGGPILEHMVHLVNYIHDIFGEIRSVKAVGKPNPENPRVYSSVETVFQFDGLIVDDWSIYSGHKQTGHGEYKPDWMVNCQFEDGTFYSHTDWNVDPPLFKLILNGEEKSKHQLEQGSDEGLPPEVRYKGQGFWETLFLDHVIDNFARSLQRSGSKKVRPYCNLWDGYKDLKVAFAIREALETGREVEIKY